MLFFLVFLALVPLINFLAVMGGIAGIFFDKYRVEKILLKPILENMIYRTLIFIFFLPWNLIVILTVLSISAVPAVFISPFMVIPSMLMNIKSFLRIAKYWSSDSRFEELEDKNNNDPISKALDNAKK